jgi:hypothetical protein
VSLNLIFVARRRFACYGAMQIPGHTIVIERLIGEYGNVHMVIMRICPSVRVPFPGMQLGRKNAPI